jgi:hypothetical protein
VARIERTCGAMYQIRRAASISQGSCRPLSGHYFQVAPALRPPSDLLHQGGVAKSAIGFKCEWPSRQYPTDHNCRIRLRRDAAKSSRSRAKRSWWALKFATRWRIWSRSELFRFTGGIRFGSMTVRGIVDSTPMLFAKAIVSSTSASRSACQLVMLISPQYENVPAQKAPDDAGAFGLVITDWFNTSRPLVHPS